MRCFDYRLAAEDRPTGAASLSPRLVAHLDSCPSCQHWEADRASWGDLGALFRSEEPPAADLLTLRTRVRATVSGLDRARSAWLRPALGTLAAGVLLAAALFGLLREAPLPGRGHVDETVTSEEPGNLDALAANEGQVPAGQERTPEELFRIVRVGNDFGIEWPSNGERVHRIVRSNDPADFSNGEEMLVRGSRWVDSSPGPEGSEVQYFLID
jgi:hypothetical protein